MGAHWVLIRYLGFNVFKLFYVPICFLGVASIVGIIRRGSYVALAEPIWLESVCETLVDVAASGVVMATVMATEAATTVTATSASGTPAAVANGWRILSLRASS